jgi:OmpR-family two-component system manganese-sensing response regulator
MINPKILLVEDDQNLAYLLGLHFRRERFLVDHAENGGQALAQLKNHNYDVIVLDWMLPDLSGIEICQQYRERGGKSPIMMLTAKGTVDDRACGLDAGADDYMVKPFHPKELTARVRALLRRPPIWEGKVLQVKDIEFDTAQRRVTRNGQEIDLTGKELALLELLMRYPNRNFSLEAILDRLWQSDSAASIDTVRTHMKTLRKKIGDSESEPIIRTKRGMGYSLVV